MPHKRNGQITRRTADKHRLYEWSVQEPQQEVDFLSHLYRKRRGRRALVLREDFCGTAAVACHWAKSHPKRTALGLDIDASTLHWAETHNRASIGKHAERVDLLRQDVRTVTRPKADVACALNFSYYVFHDTRELESYFEKVRESLAPGGIFVVDLYGGWESQQVMEEPRRLRCPMGRRFSYIWDQADWDPISNLTTCHIHFEFPNGERWDRAFSYRWRHYTPAEVREALRASGFKNIEVYWDCEEDEDKCKYRPRKRAENQPGWLAYVAADA